MGEIAAGGSSRLLLDVSVHAALFDVYIMPMAAHHLIRARYSAVYQSPRAAGLSNGVYK